MDIAVAGAASWIQLDESFPAGGKLASFALKH